MSEREKPEQILGAENLEETQKVISQQDGIYCFCLSNFNSEIRWYIHFYSKKGIIIEVSQFFKIQINTFSFYIIINIIQ
jgi:hypothetical protein